MRRGARRRRRSAGITLLELMVCVVLVVILSAAVTRAFVASIDAERAFDRRRGEQTPKSTVEPKLRQLIESAMLTDSATTDTTTYFLGEYGNNGTTSQQQSGTSASGSALTGTGTTGTSSTGSSSSSGSNTTTGGTDLGCDRLTFTTTAPDVPLSPESSTDDFLTQQQKYGPIGGVAEVSFSTTAVGDAGDRIGLFERIQRPADGDATQGGSESLVSDKIKNMGFQFWDGTEWVDQWDTTTTPDTGRLPSAVMVSYTVVGDAAETVYQFVVQVPESNVTLTNPITQTTSGAAQ